MDSVLISLITRLIEQKWRSRLSKDKIAEFLTKTERTKDKNTQNMFLDECNPLFEESLQKKDNVCLLFPESVQRNRPKFFEESLTVGMLVKKIF